MARSIGVAVLMFVALISGATAALPLDLDPPQVSLAGIRIAKLTPNEQSVVLSLRVRNPNMMDIPLHSMRYQLELNGERVASGRRDKPVTLPGGAEKTVDVEADASLQEVINQMQQMAGKGFSPVKYRLHGEFRLGNGSTPMPFDQSGSIDLSDLAGIGSGRHQQRSKPDYI
ncbi:MAG: LEA type 2 family protein [Gammaproteobacteria bacterium]